MQGSRFLFVMWEGGGNVPPQLGLARRLVSRGHSVRVLTEPSVADDVRASGAEFVSFSQAPHRHDRSRDSDFVRDFDARTPMGAFAAVRDRVLLGPARAYAVDTMAEIERFQPHVLAPDWILTGAAVAGEAAGVPTALLVHNVNLVPEPGKAAPGFGFLPATSAAARVRDRFFTHIYLRLFNRGLPALNEARRAFDLAPLGHVVDHFPRAERFLCLYSEDFDLPVEEHLPNLRYTGAVLEQPAWADAWTSPWADDDSRPLVVISMSTTFMSQEQPIRRCIEAVASLPVRALVTVGPTLDPRDFPAPDNIAVVRSAPHDAVFRNTAAVVTHAGLGTVTRALAHGLPVVCMPMGRDQDDVAARVRWHGAGLRVRRGASPAKIGEALQRVLHEPSFRAAAARLRATIEADLATEPAIAELESLVGASAAMEGAGARRVAEGAG